MNNKQFNITVILLLLATSSMAKHSLEYQVSPVGNLIYQLDCITKPSHFSCAQADFIALWEGEIKSQQDDQKYLDMWLESRQALDQNVTFSTENSVSFKTSPNFPTNAGNKINLLERIRVMAFKAETLKSYADLLELWLPEKRVADEIRVLEYFWPRFDAWYKAPQKDMERFVKEAEILTQKLNLSQTLDAMRVFYHSQLPADMVLPVNLIAHPKAQGHTSGLVYGKNSLIEVLQGEKAADRMAVVVHEIAHFYHETAPSEHHQMVMDYFLSDDAQSGKVGYFLFNEAMATAIGNGMIEQAMKSTEYFTRYLAHPMSFYADEAIDAAAKSSFELVKDAFAQGSAVDKKFLIALDAQWHTDLNQLLKKPRNLFRHVGIMIMNESLHELSQEIFSVVRPSSAQLNTFTKNEVITDSLLDKFSDLDVIIIAASVNELQSLKLPKYSANDAVDQTLVLSDGNRNYVVIVSAEPAYIKSAIEKIVHADTLR
jgi:hypothetical protein